MSDLYEVGDEFLRRASFAKGAVGAPGADPTGSVAVTLDADGRVAGVSVVADWRTRLGDDRLGEAVLEAVRDALSHRLAAWAEGYAAGGEGGASEPRPDPAELLRRLEAAEMSDEDRRAALAELLAMAQEVEKGIDELSGRLRAALGAAYTGRSPDRRVTVSMTGGGEVTEVRFDRAWLRQAHELNVGRQVTAAFRAAYEQVAAHSVPKLIADSPLGAVQRAGQDPLGLARRLRITESR